MDTFNLAFVLQRKEFPPVGPVVTIVCHSEEEIDQKEVQRVAMQLFNRFMKPGANMAHVFSEVLAGIKRECGVQAVLVEANCVTVISF